MSKVNLRDKLAMFDERWAPRIVGELNGQRVLVAKLEGEFVWHHHADEDELFYVVEGRLDIEVRDGIGEDAEVRTVALEPGELFIVPRGVEHRPIAHGEVQVMLFEPATTLNTGNVTEGRTVREPERI